jgi:hypothetical protein
MVESAAWLLDTYFMNSKLIRIGALQSPIVMERPVKHPEEIQCRVS